MKVDIKEILELIEKEGNTSLVEKVKNKYYTKLQCQDKEGLEYLNNCLEKFNLGKELDILQLKTDKMYDKYYELELRVRPNIKKNKALTNKKELREIAKKLSTLKVEKIKSNDELMKLLLLI